MKKVLLAALFGGIVTLGGIAAAHPDSKPSRLDAASASISVAADDGIVVPSQNIVAPTKPVAPGKNIRFGVSPLPNPKPKGLASITHAWVISPKVDDLFTWPDNTQGVFGGGVVAATYNITRVSTYSYVDDSGKLIATRTVEQDCEVSVEGLPNPTPVPPPTPTPQPQPPSPGPAPTPTPPPVPPAPTLPDGKFKLAQTTFNLAKGMPKDQAKQLSGVFKAVQSKIAAGGITTKAAFIQEIANNTSVLGDNLKNWIPVLDAIAKEWNTTLKSQLNTPADFGDASSEVAAGLDAVAAS